MEDETTDYMVEYHDLMTAWGSNARRDGKGILNIVSKTENREVTETSEFKLENFRTSVIPAINSPAPKNLVFCEFKKQIFVYQFGDWGKLEMLLDGGKSRAKITIIHFVSDIFSMKKCLLILDQFPNLKEVNLDILAFDDDPLTSFVKDPPQIHGTVLKLIIKTHQSRYKEFTPNELQVLEKNCVGLLQACETIFPNLSRIDFILPLEYEVHMYLLDMVERSKVFKHKAWMGGFHEDKLICHAPVKPAERRRLNPELAKLLCPPVGRASAKGPTAEPANEPVCSPQKTRVKKQENKKKPTKKPLRKSANEPANEIANEIANELAKEPANEPAEALAKALAKELAKEPAKEAVKKEGKPEVQNPWLLPWRRIIELPGPTVPSCVPFQNPLDDLDEYPELK